MRAGAGYRVTGDPYLIGSACRQARTFCQDIFRTRFFFNIINNRGYAARQYRSPVCSLLDYLPEDLIEDILPLDLVRDRDPFLYLLKGQSIDRGLQFRINRRRRERPSSLFPASSG